VVYSRPSVELVVSEIVIQQSDAGCIHNKNGIHSFKRIGKLPAVLPNQIASVGLLGVAKNLSRLAPLRGRCTKEGETEAGL
jgi:hypothetical protein